jgi:hypothetical protein
VSTQKFDSETAIETKTIDFIKNTAAKKIRKCG